MSSSSSSSSSPPNLFRLCSLLHDSLLPYTETKWVLFTKEKEKDLLILLSQISRKIKAWEDELRPHSDERVWNFLRKIIHADGTDAFKIMSGPTFEEIEVNSTSNCKCCHVLEPLSGEGHDCIASVVYILVVFLVIENQYVRHTAGNILVIISNFLVQAGSNAKIFFQLLWAGLEAVILKIHSSTLSGSNTSGEERLTGCDTHTTDYHIASFISLLLPKLLNANWAAAAALVQVLHKILKSLKNNHGELAEEYLQSFSHSLPNVSWDLLHENHVARCTGTWMIHSKDLSLHQEVGSPGQKEIFLGTLLQLFCSLVDPNGLEEISGSSFDGLPFLTEIIDLVPNLLCWCLSSHVNYKLNCISRYLRHKMLMLMIRLSFRIHHQCSVIVLWLQLLRQYFEDLLHKSISELHDEFDNCLEGSPFQLCVADGENAHSLCTRHLQRQAIFLLFKCSFSLTSFSEETGRQCPCAEGEHCSVMGWSELCEWLQRHVPPEKFVDYDTSLKICCSFALSFLRLYMDEDDFLFEMLLQLLRAAFPKSIQFKHNDNIIEEVKADKSLYISSIFNPIHVFHLFLAELHYDHIVLLDYLISKDSGVNCAQYLLRCLRIVCNSWHFFVEFSFCGSESSQTSGKKRKVCIGRQESQGKVASKKVLRNPNSLEKRRRIKNDVGSMPKAFRQTFENAKGCLFSLKESVENLHQKNLFPYNPSALLRSFNRFQELCELQEEGYLQKRNVVV